MAAALLAVGMVAQGMLGRAAAQTEPDALAADVSRWSNFLTGNPATDDLWKQVREGSEPALARADRALRDGRRLLAALRLAPVRENLYAARYLGDRTAQQRRDMAAFEAEWRRVGGILKEDLSLPAASALAAVRPTAMRAMAEVALAKLPVYYHASLDYGRNTAPESGLFYLGAAQAQRDFALLARRLSVPKAPPPPPVRALDADLDALQSEVLAAYRPPASVDKHPEFIVVSSLIKEARELGAAGWRYGALLRYLQAAMRFGVLRPLAPGTEAPVVVQRLKSFEPRLSMAGVDHSLGRLLMEAAEADLAERAADGAATTASAVATDVLPRYFAALEPAPRKPPAEVAKVTVTLVRWPYT
jgi:hypothetical protein